MVDRNNIQHIANLARLGITEEEQNKFEKDLSSILDYFNFLKELNVSKIEPTFHPTEFFLRKQENTMREDKTKPIAAGRADKLIEAAPDKDKRHIKIKAVF